MTHIYDDPEFFDAYNKMARSQYGLSGAGEWHAFRALLPDARDMKVLDLGCGYGWHAKFLVDNGATCVHAIDASSKMIEKAKSINADKHIDYRQEDIETIDFGGPYNLAISSLVFHYIEDIGSLFQRVYDALDDDGQFIFTVEHPIFTSHKSQDFIYESGVPKFFPVDDYFMEGIRETEFLGTKVKKYHHTMTSYFEALVGAGFTVEKLIEPTPPESMMEIPAMKNELRRPMMLIFKAIKRNY